MRMYSKWNMIPLEEAVEICDSLRKPINAKERQKRIAGKNSSELYPYYGATGQVGYIDDYITDGEYVLLGEDGAPFLNSFAQKAYIISGKTWVNNHAHVLKSKSNNKFLCYYLNYFNYNGYVSGTTRLKLTQNSLKQIYIPNPSLDEQERIVSKIEELFSKLEKGVEELNKIKEQLKIYRQAVLKEAFEGKWSYDNRQSVNIETVDKTLVVELPTLPNEWEYVYLSKLGELSRGKSKHRPRNDKKLFEDGKYPFVQTGDVKAANKYLTSYSTMYGDFGLAQSKLWKKGTLCITIAANIAETCILGIDACFPDSVVGFDPQEDIVDRDYVRYFIEASKIRLSAFAPATAQKNINLTTLENLIIPYCHIDEQKYIVTEIESRLSVCDKIEQTVNESLQKAESLRQSILKQAFEGNLV